MIPIVQVTALTAAIAAGVPNASYRDLGPASANTPISVAVTLAYHHPKQLDQLVALQANPRSPYYHHWLTSEQFDTAFAPSPSEYARALASLHRAGFEITQTFANRTVIDATATIGTAERYFATRIDRVAQSGHGIRYVNIAPARVPNELDGLLFTVTGLHNLDIARGGTAQARRLLPSWQRLRRAATAAPLLFGPSNASDGQIGYGPLAFLRGYDFVSRHDKIDTGSGRVSAIVTNGNFAESDLAGFLAYFHIKRTGPATKRILTGAKSQENVSYDPMTTLEAESLVGLAPGTTLYLYQITGSGGSASDGNEITDAFNRVVSDGKADVVDAPFGQCESTDVTATTSWDHIAEQGSALGMTFEAPLYDNVDAWTNGECNGWVAPATSPHFTAIGGTELVVNDVGTYQTEFPALAGLFDGTEVSFQGGASSVFPLPSWQQGVQNIVTGGRNTPDVAFDASYYTGLALYYGGTWQGQYNPASGVQLASSIFAAALVQTEQSGGTRLGSFAPTLYALWQANGYQHGATTYFHKIMIPGNKVGYDNWTGIGSFDVWNLAKLLGR